ncbi:MAG: glycosyltransferase [Candidatus Woesebacteria bacterium]|nr:MAG: glycosyltransferase [Candidatus Woesebacteria bacterium]
MGKKSLQNLNIAIATHIFATGPALELEEYLKNKVNSLLFIGNPFPYSKEKRSFYRFYLRGKLKKEHKFLNVSFLDTLSYFKDAIITFFWTIRSPRKINLFIASDNFLGFVGIVLKEIGKVDEIILYTIDYMPKRFTNSFLNYLYHYFDKICMKKSKIIWNVSSKISEAREEYSGIRIKDSCKQIVVPLGVWYKRIPKTPFNKRQKNSIIFMGHLLEKQGLNIVIESLPEIIKKIPDVSLTIIGTGPYERELVSLVKKLKLSKWVKFMGYIESHQEIERILSQKSMAVATYKPDPESFTYFADPGKIKNYLAAGLPVILTNVPPIATDLEDKKCALICRYDKKDFCAKIISLINNKIKLRTYSNNASSYAKQFDWNKIFAKALKSSL